MMRPDMTDKNFAITLFLDHTALVNADLEAVPG